MSTGDEQAFSIHSTEAEWQVYVGDCGINCFQYKIILFNDFYRHTSVVLGGIDPTCIIMNSQQITKLYNLLNR